jgi:DNA-binding NarL/FixJ family response regulator
MGENPTKTSLSQLTPREIQALHLVAIGKTNKEIASDLHICRRVVEKHLTSIYRKLNVKTRTEAAIFAFQNNLCEKEGSDFRRCESGSLH